ncbi:hypothetical protein ACF0H5_000437 [Mactra antiquata]
MRGLPKLLDGIVKYTLRDKKQAALRLQQCTKNPEPLGVMFSCMDSRVLPTRFTQSDLGDTFMVKNAGNFVPYPDDVIDMSNTSAPSAALDLTCVKNSMKHVIVTGHSDCKAMILLHNLRNEVDNQMGSPLELWVKKHGRRSLKKFDYLTKENKYVGPVPFHLKGCNQSLQVSIDPENKFCETDKLSQVNCVQQIENIAAYPFLKDRLHTSDLFIHGFWFDVNSGNVFMLSKKQQKFVEVNESTYSSLLEEVKDLD